VERGLGFSAVERVLVENGSATTGACFVLGFWERNLV
jgi:hypothetical protein